MASVKLKFRVSSLPEKEGTLFFQVIHGGVVRQVRTPYRIFKSEWDEHRNDIVQPLSIPTNRRGVVKSIRDKVTREKKQLERIIDNLRDKEVVFSVDEIIQEYYASSIKKTTVFEYIKLQMERLKNAGKERTSEIYNELLMSFMKFRNGEDLHFEMIDDSLVCQYESYMRISNLCRNTTSFYLRVLRSVFNRAVREGITEQSNPFKGVYTGVDKTSKRAIGLNEIKRIKDLDLSSMPALDFARDMFLFSFYMRGMSFIDIAYLRKRDLSNGFVVYNRRKTGQQMVVKWEKSMDDIVNKHCNVCNDFMFPIITVPDEPQRKQYLNKMLLINRHLKRVAHLAGINVPLTMYVARHSWASIAQSQKIPIKAISLGMGHDSEETTRIYLSSIQTNVIDSANNKILKLLEKRS